MTKAELIAATRYLANEISTDAGALLSDSGNLLEFLNDAADQVTLDLVPTMPTEFMATENITLVAGTAGYALTNTPLQIWKVERTVTGDPPLEMEIVDPLDMAYHMDTGETEDNPHAVYFIGKTVYFVKTPASAKTNYAKVWEILGEPATMATAGPTYIPAIAHRLIVYKAASIIATMLQKDPTPYLALYAMKLQQVQNVWRGRFQSQPRFVKESAATRQGYILASSEDHDPSW
jgi:hypothetical protein